MEAIRDGGLLGESEIAYKVGIQELTLEHILSLLTSKGYLESVDCHENMFAICLGCPLSRECAPRGIFGNIYTVTAKGRGYIERHTKL